MSRIDCLVVGAGLAGCTAALRAAEAGASVRIVSAAGGATSLMTGLVDLGRDPSEVSHPYRRLGAERLDEAMSFVSGALTEAGCPIVWGERRTFLAASGMWVASNGAQLGQSRGPDETLDESVGLWTWEETGDRPFCHPVGPGLPEPVRVPVPPGRTDVQRAARLEREEAREAFVSVLRRALPDASCLLGPPIWGLADHGATLEAAEATADGRLAEWIPIEAGVPSRRLELALRKALASRGVRVEGGRVVDLERDRDGFHARFLRRGEAGEEIQARTCVLATGRFVGGGCLSRNRVAEPLTERPLRTNAGLWDELQEEQRAGEHLDKQPWARIGLPVTNQSQVAAPTGAPLEDGLFAAGDLVTGHDAAADGSGFGVAVLTGVVSGMEAARVAGKEVPCST